MKGKPSAGVRVPARVVAFGGGTGLSSLLRGLKKYVARRRGQPARMPIADLAAVVTVTDDGGSSGRLRRDYHVLPPGDIRNCLVALSADEALLGRLFQYRFPRGPGLGGHSFGNLFLTALTGVTGDFAEAVRVSSEVLAIRGRIFPSTTDPVGLEGELENGLRILGETRISRSKRRIRRVRLRPRRVRPLPEVLDAIGRADLILIGPGSLYTSVIPSLLVDGIADAVRRSQALRVYIGNLMTQPGETTGYSSADHVKALIEHFGPGMIDWVVLNRGKPSSRLSRRYGAQGAGPVETDIARIEALGYRALVADVMEESVVVRHHPDRLARLLVRRFLTP
ncbi:MAG TPA: gluconeogenesis factor YvcK family protein [Candidatus Dormibacteraeota bacterium]|nr:gluconeogenesis factor YvcK family protein [Candidatus Dormibacteraeota bacterium]